MKHKPISWSEAKRRKLFLACPFAPDGTYIIHPRHVVYAKSGEQVLHLIWSYNGTFYRGILPRYANGHTVEWCTILTSGIRDSTVCDVINNFIYPHNHKEG